MYSGQWATNSAWEVAGLENTIGSHGKDKPNGVLRRQPRQARSPVGNARRYKKESCFQWAAGVEH